MRPMLLVATSIATSNKCIATSSQFSTSSYLLLRVVVMPLLLVAMPLALKLTAFAQNSYEHFCRPEL